MRDRMESTSFAARWQYEVHLDHQGNGRFEPTVIRVRMPVDDKDRLARILEKAAPREE
jgi:hypothetical protein